MHASPLRRGGVRACPAAPRPARPRHPSMLGGACVPHPRPSGHRSRAVHGVAWDLRLTFPEFRPTTTRPKINSLLLSEVPALASARLAPAARSRPTVSLSLTLFSPGPQTKHRRCKRISRNRRPRLARAGPSPGPIAVVLDGPSPSARTPRFGRPLVDESNLGWAVTRQPPCVNRLACSSHTRMVRRAFTAHSR